MMHKSKFFFCPGQSRGIAWNICLGRQDSGFEACDNCSYRGWHEKGLPGFNPYIGAFTHSEDPRKHLKTLKQEPSRGRIYREKVKAFKPEDVGLEDARKKSWMFWFSEMYKAI
jgi:hypothetical protein